MMLRLIAPAKLNLTLEVLGKRNDGYHEIASVIQTMDLADRIFIEPSDNIDLEMEGPEAGALPADSEANLAYRAAIALREAAGHVDLGARIALHKKIPAGAGLGGGSSDAAGVLRGLNALWNLHLSIGDLASIAITLGSDVPFFLHGGTALASGRGEHIEPLQDVPPFDVTLLIPTLDPTAKTERMYAALDRSDSDPAAGMLPGSAGGRISNTVTNFVITGPDNGTRTRQLTSHINQGSPLAPEDLYNAFDRILTAASPEAARALSALRKGAVSAIACGSGPAIFTLGTPDTLRPALDTYDAATLRLIACRSLSREAAVAVTEA
jgi:4-diphosphocytidyl-2-C-methyl-D-erythritol kinase